MARLRRIWTASVLLGLAAVGCHARPTETPAAEPVAARTSSDSARPDDGEAARPAAPTGSAAAASSVSSEPTETTEPDDAWEIVEVERVAIPDEAARFDDRVARPPPRPPHAAPEGALDRDIIRRIVREQIRALRGCYDTHDPEGRALGHVQQRWVLDGEVTRAEFRWTDAHARAPAGLLDCLQDVAARWKFPPPEGMVEPTPWMPSLPATSAATSPS